MINNCPKCGTNIKTGSKFCINCGNAVQEISYNTITTQQPVSQESYTETQTLSEISSKKYKKKLIGIVFAIIALIVIIVFLIIFLSGGSLNNQLVGTWNMSYGENTSIPFDLTLTFQANGDLKVGYMGLMEGSIGTWSIEDDKLCIDSELIEQYTSGKQCLNYSFLDGGNTLLLKDPTGLYNLLILTK